MPLRTRCGTSRLPCMSLGVRAQGLGPRGGGTALAITICSVLPSVPYDAVGPPKFILLSRLNIQPARLPVNASPLLSRTTTHDSGPIWFATPSLGGTRTRETYRFVPAHRKVKILMRLPYGRNVATRQAVHGSAPWARSRDDVDHVIWTALGPKFRGDDPPTEDQAVDYLSNLSGDHRSRAEKYVRCASPQIDTAYRRRIIRCLRWIPAS